MKLSGSYKLSVKKNVVWEALNDPNILKQCIPGCESFDKENENTFKAIATNQIGPMNASFSGTVNLSNIKPNESYTLSGEGNSSVGFVNGSADVKLLEENNNNDINHIFFDEFFSWLSICSLLKSVKSFMKRITSPSFTFLQNCQ